MSRTAISITDIPLDDSTIMVSIGTKIQKDKNSNGMYVDLLTKHVSEFNKRYDNIYACYQNSASLKRELEIELDVFETVQRNELRIKELQKQILALTKKTENDCEPSSSSKNKPNLTGLRQDLDKVIEKYMNGCDESESNSQSKDYILNTGTDTPNLDYVLLDKINERVPSGKDILLKNIVKDINGSAKGLSDFVLLFQKFGNAIYSYNSLEYFQRKGCHFIHKKAM
jgi:hypothetical protein